VTDIWLVYCHHVWYYGFLQLQVPSDYEFERQTVRSTLPSSLCPRDHARLTQIRVHTRNACRDTIRALRRFLGPVCPPLPPTLQLKSPHARNSRTGTGRAWLCGRGFPRSRYPRSSMWPHFHQRRELFPMQVSSTLSFSLFCPDLSFQRLCTR
jgi:hypothetical protein